MGTPRRAGIYCRLSFAPDGSTEKVERQEADCRALAKTLGWGVARVYPDNSRSAWQRNRKRPQWEQMLLDIEAGLIDGIIVYHGDRLIRQPLDLEKLLDISDNKHLPLAAPSGTRNLSSEDDRFALRIEVALACRSSADTSRRVKRAVQARVEKGAGGAGSNRPFGYGVPTDAKGRTGNTLYDLNKQNRKEARIGKEAVRRFLAGESQGSVIAWLNTECTTTTGRPWRANAFRAWLSAPRTAGLIEYQGQLLPAKWKGIITPDQRADVLALLKANSDSYGYAGRERVYLLTGKAAQCGGCEGPLYTKPSGKSGARMYYCKNRTCPSPVSRNVRLLDEYIIGRTLRVLSDPRFMAAVQGDTETPGLGAEIAALERRKSAAQETLKNLGDHPGVDPSLLVAGLSSYDRKIKQLREQMTASTQHRILLRMAGVTRKQWDAEPIDVRAETIRSLFQVTVLPAGRRGPGFDPSTVRVKRRL